MKVEVMQRDGFCRGCDKVLRRNRDTALKFYSCRNRGQYILLCSSCVDRMSALWLEHIMHNLSDNCIAWSNDST